MPLLLRTVEPTHVARGTLPDRFPVENDLEAVSNGTLSNVIRQLSALSHHAEELFADLIGVASGIALRAGNLQARIDRLAVRVGQIDAIQEESPSIHESLNTKPFTSSLIFDQQVVSRSTLPPSMLKSFQGCDMPPPLDKLNKYRDDGRNGLKFYTDPSYFFDLWRQEMLKDTERIDRGKKPHKLKHDGQSRHKKRIRQPHNRREQQLHLVLQQGEHIMNAPTPVYQPNQANNVESHDGHNHQGHAQVDARSTYGPMNVRVSNLDMEQGNGHVNNRTVSMSSMHQHHLQRQQYEAYQRYYASQNTNYESPNYRNNRNTPVNGYRPSQPPPAPPPNYVIGTPPQGTPTSMSMQTPPNMNMSNRMSRSNHRETLPPPPPPPIDSTMFPHPEEDDLPPPPPTPIEQGLNILRTPNIPEEHLPPSPPPPPLDDNLCHQAPPPPPPPPMMVQMMNGLENVNINNPAPKPKQSRKTIVVEKDDGRNELLKAIRDGIALRKVETTGTKVEEKSSTYHDVASILARRVAVEMSDSDSGSSDYDSDGWDEAST